MTQFFYHNPTKIFFGENSIKNLGEQLRNCGKNILLAYGGGSIKENGIYDSVMSAMTKEGKNVFELQGIMPNPRTEKVYEGIEICKKNSVDFILAVGGGSTIDCVKAIAAGAKTEEDFWSAFYLNHGDCKDALPIGAVLTLAGTGSEMNGVTVISNWGDNLKLGYGNPILRPVFSILDPTYTYSLPKNQLVYGTIDILSHLFETYFSPPDASNLSDSLNEAIMKNIIENLNVALKTPDDYTARANLMWASTMAMNGIVKLSKTEDWQSHQIEHALSAFYDIPHGAGLAIVHPNHMEYTFKAGLSKYVRYATNVWNVDPTGKTDEAIALEGISLTKSYYKSIGAPTTLTEVSIPKEKISEMAKTVNLTGRGYMKLDVTDIENILLSAV